MAYQVKRQLCLQAPKRPPRVCPSDLINTPVLFWMTHININPGMIPDLSMVSESVTAPEPRAARSMDNLTCLTIKTGNPDCIAHFYPALYQLTLVRNKTEEKVELGFSGSRLLERLARNPGEVVSREDLLSHAWSDRVVGQGSLNQQIYTLRQILGDEKEREIIQTLPRRGYQLNPNCVELSVVVTPPPVLVLPVVADVVAPVEASAPANIIVTPPTPARRWPLLTAATGLVALLAVALIWHNTNTRETTATPRLDLSYATQNPDELATLKSAGEQLRRHLQPQLKQPVHVILGLDQNMLDITCLSQDGSARALHFSPDHILSAEDLRSCLP